MLRAFLRTEAGSTSVLLGATVLALLWANSPWADTYETFWRTTMGISFGDAHFSLDLRHWVNDGIMTVFFFLIGLEVSYEVRLGQLRDRRLIAVPAVAALGGMLVPAGLYLLLNHGGPGPPGGACRSPPTPPSCWACWPWWGPGAPIRCGRSC
ncbi:hypothetical protein GCM10022224_014240 [Nonomuraea antimicrobica]|uniref:Na+:H+ antiporter, NhaA family n=1 Tax=Nonomuraea antimicrobica TaxID=561173 RepID=A0ABP7B839_9ACTN